MSSNAFRNQDVTHRGQGFSIFVDDQTILALPGETLTSFLLANGIRASSRTPLAEVMACYKRVGGQPPDTITPITIRPSTSLEDIASGTLIDYDQKSVPLFLVDGDGV